MKNQLKFKGQLKRLMERERLNQQELAQLLDVCQPAISLYLRGRIPPAEILLKMAQLGNTTVDWLLIGTSSSSVSRVQEPIPQYGSEHTLLSYWRKLKPEVRSSLLSLMKQLTK
jgi:transcriptional regulator with XRE-family HTH domain